MISLITRPNNDKVSSSIEVHAVSGRSGHQSNMEKICAHILFICTVNFQQYLLHSFYPVVLACIACDIVIVQHIC